MEDTADLRVVAGLGNPGPAYVRTRHNLGFMVLDELAAGAGLAFRKRGLDAEVADLGRVSLVRPLRFMNLSGRPISAALKRAGARPGQLLVIHDDLDLPLGRMRFRFGGSSGGQRGVQDTIGHVGKDFWRLKLGIGKAPPGTETSNWVLGRFTPAESEIVAGLIPLAADAVRHALESGADSAASRYNGTDLRKP